MRVVYERCCGLDVHKKTVVACVLIDFDEWRDAASYSHLLDHDRWAARGFRIG
jgi:hypothetical protein